MSITHAKLIKFVLPFALVLWFLVASDAAARPRTCEPMFSSPMPDLLAKSGMNPTDIRIKTFHQKNNRVWIEIRKTDGTPIGRIALRPGGRSFFQIEIALLEEGYEGKGLGFLLYQAAAHVASERYNRVLSSGRNSHSPDAEKLWKKMIASDAAAIRFLPLLALVNYLNEVTPRTPITPDEVSTYVDRFGQSIYVMNRDSAAAVAFRKIYEKRGSEVINTE